MERAVGAEAVVPSAQPADGTSPSGQPPKPPNTKRQRRGRGHDTPTTQLSREMSKVLRHKPPPGEMDAQGWVALPVLAAHLRSKPSEQQIRQVVADNDKQRFAIDDSTTPPRIRAAQGHSVALDAPVLTPVTDASSVALAVHVTSDEGWQAIQASGELRAMTRTHIHFAAQPSHLRLNKWACVLLRLDLRAALSAGHAFGLSTNGVLLAEGPLPIAFVSLVREEELPPEWSRMARAAAKAPNAAEAGAADVAGALADSAGTVLVPAAYEATGMAPETGGQPTVVQPPMS